MFDFCIVLALRMTLFASTKKFPKITANDNGTDVKVRRGDKFSAVYVSSSKTTGAKEAFFSFVNILNIRLYILTDLSVTNWKMNLSVPHNEILYIRKRRTDMRQRRRNY